ncbi:putative small nuclear ribonucleoprotein polypeptide F [Lineolata rhizophorae]|uniref:Sm protein F n=1 Tax=Lineolata rhizophorae TaxID=578093 RepID=A0A6A6PAK0_9PEZI|nr:putative small nuclear ribonucleoprotein polypeptide F [Lineolata rhizophorae]
MSTAPLNPRPFLNSLVGGPIHIKLKWGHEYTGRLVAVDSYMNVLLQGTVEHLKDGKSETLGQVLIRCNNVLWIVRGKEDTEMSG